MLRRIAFFWGKQPMSWLRYLTIYSFRKLNPDWKIEIYVYEAGGKDKCWRERNQQDFFNYVGEDYWPKVLDLQVDVKEWGLPESLRDQKISPVHASDLFEWQYLAEVGGVYSDMDILYVRPIDKWFNEISHKDVALAFTEDYFSIALMASSAPNVLFADILKQSIKNFSGNRYQNAGVLALYRTLGMESDDFVSKPWFNILEEKYPNVSVANFSMDYVYLFRYSFASHAIFHQKWETLPNCCIGLHWYAGAPFSQAWNCRLTQDNWAEYDNTFTHFLKQIGGTLCAK